jgi:O-succinylbenzoate synthase
MLTGQIEKGNRHYPSNDPTCRNFNKNLFTVENHHRRVATHSRRATLNHFNMSIAHPPFLLKRYRRRFARPMRAAWGTWAIREGWLMRCADGEAPFGYGEICPLPAMGSTTPEPEFFTAERAFASWACQSTMDGRLLQSARTASLLSLDDATAESVRCLRDQGFTTHKIKVGIQDRLAEWHLLEPILLALPESERIRIDPNRSWSLEDWTFWSARLNDHLPCLEFVEEPFPHDTPAGVWLEIAHQTLIPLALDESLSGSGLAQWHGLRWPGYWIVKPSLMGPPDSWMELLAPARHKIILSSAFETAIGLTALLRIAARLPHQTVHGLGTQAWFNDDWGLPQDGPLLHPPDPTRLEALWNSICD